MTCRAGRTCNVTHGKDKYACQRFGYNDAWELMMELHSLEASYYTDIVVSGSLRS